MKSELARLRVGVQAESSKRSSGDRVDGRGSNHACNRHELPRQVVTVARVKHSSCHPGCSPLAEGVAHDDERQKFSQRSGAKAFGGYQRDEHVVGAHGKTKDNGEGPEHRGRMWPREQKYGSSDQKIEKSHDAGFSEAISHIADQHSAAQTRREQYLEKSRSCGWREAGILEKKNKVLNHCSDGADDQSGSYKDEPKIGGVNS